MQFKSQWCRRAAGVAAFIQMKGAPPIWVGATRTTCTRTALVYTGRDTAPDKSAHKLNTHRLLYKQPVQHNPLNRTTSYKIFISPHMFSYKIYPIAMYNALEGFENIMKGQSDEPKYAVD